MRALVFHILELRYLVRGVRAYARRRTPRVRRYLGSIVRWTYPREVSRRRQLVTSLPPAPASIPDDVGVLDLSRVLAPQIDGAVAEAHRLLPSLDLPGRRSAQPGLHLHAIPLREHLERDSAILRLALDPSLVRIVSDYLGTLPVVEDIYLWYSPNEANVDGSSQFHHLDGQDVRTLQLFVNLEDVSADQGPLTALSARASEEIARSISYRKNEVTKRVPDEVVAEHVRDDRDVHVLAGPRGSAWIVDTDRCFHFGSRAGSKPRHLLVLQYYTPFAFVLPRRWSTALPYAPEADRLASGELERRVLGAV